MRKFSIPGLSLLILLAILYQSCNKLDKADFRTLVSVQILPDDTVLVIGQSIQFRAIGTFLDSSKRDITEDINWFASPAGLLRMSEKGYANVLDTGDVYVVCGAMGLISGCIVKNTTPEGFEKELVLQDYYHDYVTSELADCGWTGSIANCDPGTVSADAQKKVVQRINYFRHLVGVQDKIFFNQTFNEKCQVAALMVKSNSTLNHYPDSATSSCWTRPGFDGCANSNLSMTEHTTSAITSYIKDEGLNNKNVSHRRLLLFTKARQMGHGSTDNSNAIWVLQGTTGTPAYSPEYIAYPPKGYVPATLVFPRWSFGLKDADFSDATVTMKDTSNQIVKCAVISRTDNGVGDNTIVWEPEEISTTGPGDVTYIVTIGNILVGSETKSYTYTVIIIQVSN